LVVCCLIGICQLVAELCYHFVVLIQLPAFCRVYSTGWNKFMPLFKYYWTIQPQQKPMLPTENKNRNGNAVDLASLPETPYTSTTNTICHPFHLLLVENNSSSRTCDGRWFRWKTVTNVTECHKEVKNIPQVMFKCFC